MCFWRFFDEIHAFPWFVDHVLSFLTEIGIFWQNLHFFEIFKPTRVFLRCFGIFKYFSRCLDEICVSSAIFQWYLDVFKYLFTKYSCFLCFDKICMFFARFWYKILIFAKITDLEIVWNWIFLNFSDLCNSFILVLSTFWCRFGENLSYLIFGQKVHGAILLPQNRLFGARLHSNCISVQ